MPSDDEDKKLRGRDIFKVFQGLPKVLWLVWESSPMLTLGIALITLLQGMMPLATVIIARLLIDGALQAIARGALGPVVLPVVLELAVNIIGIVCSRLYTTCEILLIYSLSNHMTLLIMRKASTLDLAAFENAQFYDRLTQIRQEIGTRPLHMIMGIFRVGTSLVTLLSLFGLIFQLSWWLALLMLIVPIPTFVANSRYGERSFSMSYWQSARKRQQFYLANLLTTDVFNKEIKLFNLAKYLLERYRNLGEELFQESKELQIKHTRLNLLLSVLPLLANTGIYLYVVLQAVRRLISLGGLTQYALAINQVSQNVEGLLGSLSNMYENHLFVTMLFDFLAYEPCIVAPTQPVRLNGTSRTTSLDIEFREVSFTYPGKNEPILKNISFTLHAGKSIALVGGNGAGKTTLVKLLTRLHDPDEGTILIGGRDIKEYDPTELREQIGVIFQDFVKYSMTASENIGVGRVEEIENRVLVDVAANKSGADQVIVGLEKGYETMLGHSFEKGTELSGGEWQKIALARAFMRDAPVLILDEPTSSLDVQAEYDIFQQFRHLTAGHSVIFISHRFSTVRLADHILVIEQGRISEYGSHRELLELGGKYAELFNLQAEAYR